MCAGAGGVIDKVAVARPSGGPGWDEKLESTIRNQWSYEPYIFGGKPIPFCTAVTFVYSQR